MDYSAKFVVITGASSGIGRETALDLAHRGATVCVSARREDRLASLVAEMSGEGHIYVVADVSDRSQVGALADRVAESFGRCDILVNNAGFSRTRAFHDDDSVEVLEQVMAVNFLGAAYCTKALLPLLERSAPSHVVNVASIAGRLALSGSAAYCASKFALVGWSESLHAELAAKGIYMSLIEPGPVPTEGFPQKGLVGHPLYQLGLASTGDVAAAIRHSIEKRKVQRMVPRFYYMAQFLRLAVPGPWRFARDRLLGPRPRV